MSDEPPLATNEELRLVSLLRKGDEATFSALVDRYHTSMVRVAQMYVPTRAVAEEVAQEAWLGVLRGLDAFEGRSSLRTWIFRILVNTAKSRGQRERRSVPFSSYFDQDAEPGEASVGPERFRPLSDPDSPRHWASFPSSWEGMPEARMLSRETLARVAEAIAALPPAQAEVIRLRDVEGWTSAEVRNALDITETNQRVLLHRARSKVRRALERYFDEETATT